MLKDKILRYEPICFPLQKTIISVNLQHYHGFHTCAVKEIVQYFDEFIEWHFCGFQQTPKPESVVHCEVRRKAIGGFCKLQQPHHHKQ